MSRGFRLLCTGDLHVGRRPSRIGAAVDPRRCSCAAMFTAIVEQAIDRQVDAVLLSGDLVDQDNKYHEAYGPAERGLRRLGEAGIEAFAVAGNHDFDVLPRLAEDLGSPRFHVLGRGGTWQRASLDRRGNTLAVVGWSFPAERVSENPLRSFGAQAIAAASGGAEPVVGIVHADLDQPDSEYAPVPLRHLQSAPVALWLLGHIHRPRLVADPHKPLVLYPGSPQAMDPGEIGAHGPWLVEIDDAGKASATQLPMSLVRYDQVELDLSTIHTREAFDTALPRRLRDYVNQRCNPAGLLELCSVRLRLCGATALHRSLRMICSEVCPQLDLLVGRVRVRIEHVIHDTRPPLEMDRLARGGGVTADLARLVLQLEGNSAQASHSAEMDALIDQTAELAEGVCLARPYQLLPPPEPAGRRESSRERLLRQARLLLDELLAQKEIITEAMA